ncbi:hypothetical protein [Nostoc flagelliforme]
MHFILTSHGWDDPKDDNPHIYPSSVTLRNEQVVQELNYPEA